MERLIFRFPLFLIFLFILSTSTILAQKPERKCFTITVTQFYSGGGYMLTFLIDNNHIKVEDGLDFKKSNRHKLYGRILTKQQADSLYDFINSLSLTGLHDIQGGPGSYDGREILLNIEICGKETIKVCFHQSSLPVANAIFKKINELILFDKWRINI